MEIAFVLGIFFILCTMIFFVLVVFYPEWIGITGQVAKKNIEEHQSNQVEKGDDLDSFLEGKK
jgi:hypothetical protein